MPADVVVFLIWVALLLVPIFQEIEFFGLKFRQEVQKLKEELKTDIATVRTELRNAVDVRTTFSPQIMFPAPPPDSQLPNLEARIKTALSEGLAAYGIQQTPKTADLGVDDDAQFLFSVRHAIERELRRLAQERQLDLPTRRIAGMQLTRALTQAGVLEPNIEHAIREVYSVASPAIHAEPVTPAQVGFVRDVGPSLVGALRAIGAQQQT
ncbi:MAG TPA: DUF4136 domain-containing protein [Vicinamibacterales bacterium]